MSEEEAIEIIKEYRQDFICDKLYPYLVDSIKIILDLIDKKQKEITELKEELQRQINTRLINEEYMEDNFISKDEILEALGYQKDDEEYETMNEEKILSLISTLMSEVDRLENLEDDLTSAYISGFYDGEKKIKDRIKEKILEVMRAGYSSAEERHCQNYAYDRLKELLGENDDTKI